MAGGLTDRAGRDVIITHRGESTPRVKLQLAENFVEDTKNNIEVLPGDTIIVSRAGIIYVVGDVQRPSGFRIFFWLPQMKSIEKVKKTMRKA